ncbi:MAG: ATP-binding protein [Acidobacteriota bacterium]|nr:ATP-binding protein [Acidobacteriota bacterium]MDH3522599.1 ATP-binding protein [Acidobacteriota bacterium]
MTAPRPQFRVAIGSRFENIELVQIAIEASLDLLTLDEATSHRIGLAVREAVANAIRHGNDGDPDKRVEVECVLETDQVVVKVEDQGRGFDPRDLPDPLQPDNLLKTSGRGIFFMSQFMDEIDYSFRPEGGTIVTMRKTITPSSSAAGLKEEE